MNLLKSVAIGCVALLALGLCTTAPAAAQTAKQTKQVVPRTPWILPDLDSLRQARPDLFPIEIPDIEPEETQPEQVIHHGMPTPRYIEIMMDEGKFDQAVREFTNYMDTVQGNPCDLLYLPFTFYGRLLRDDTANAAFYQEKADFYVDKFLQVCGNTWEGLQLKESMTDPKIPDSTVVWMTKSIELDSTVVMLYLTRAHALWELKRTQEACADFKKAAELRSVEGRDMYNERCLKPW